MARRWWPSREQRTRTVKMGDVERDPDKEAPAPPPTLTAPGEACLIRAKNPAGADEAGAVSQAEAGRLS